MCQLSLIYFIINFSLWVAESLSQLLHLITSRLPSKLRASPPNIDDLESQSLQPQPSSSNTTSESQSPTGERCWDIQAIKHTQIYVVRQVAYSTELLVCINEAYKQYKQEEEKNFSTQLNTLKLSLSLLSLCVFAHFHLLSISQLFICLIIGRAMGRSQGQQLRQKWLPPTNH
jgi:hypothetical protein